MDKPNVELKVIGLKCDAPGCGYEDLSILSKDYRQYVNKPCPKCGAPLLTQADYDAFMGLEALTGLINQLEVNEADKEPRCRAKIKMDGTGKVEFEDLIEGA